MEVRESEQGHDEQDAEPTGTDQAHEHRNHRVAESTERADHDIHDAAEEVWSADHQQSLLSIADDFCIRRKEAKQPRIQHHRTEAHDEADEDDRNQAVLQDAIDAAVFPSTEILRRKRKVRLINRVHRSIYEGFDILCCRCPRHRDGSEGVDGALDDDIGQTEHGALEAGRQTDLHDGAKNLPVDMELSEVEVQCTLLPHQRDEQGDAGKAL